MSHTEALLDRNRAFAAAPDARNGVPASPLAPNRQAFLVTCMDPRVDPAQVFGLELGDAFVFRNLGGRVTPALLRDLGWVTHLHRVATPDTEWFELAVVHHTDCGASWLADDDLRRSYAATGYDDDELAADAITDPHASVRADVDTLLASRAVDDQVLVSGHVYDLTTGLVTTVVPPRRRNQG